MTGSMMGRSWSIVVAHEARKSTVTHLLLQRERNFPDADMSLMYKQGPQIHVRSKSSCGCTRGHSRAGLVKWNP